MVGMDVLRVTRAALVLVGAALRFLRRGFPGLFAVCVSAWLLGCGAARVHTEGWAQELHGKSLFRVCRRHPRVGPNARSWYELGDGVHRPAFEPLEKLLENPSVKAVFIHDPLAPPESRRLLGLAYQDLPCDKPPPPPPPVKIAAKEPEAGPAERTTIRTVTRTSAMRPCDRPGNRPPDQRFIGQTAPSPAPTPGTRVPCPPPPPGKTYEEQKVNLARREAEEEARRTGERIGRLWGDTLGRADEVKATYDRIAADPRHFALVTLNDRDVSERSFGNWSMGFEAGGEAPESGTLEEQVAALVSTIQDPNLRAYFTGFAKSHSTR